MATFQVANATQLASALSKAAGGDTILLASGNYGSVDLSGLSFSSMVTIRSADGALGAKMSSLKIQGSANIRVESVHVDSPNNPGPGGKILNIEGSRDIEIRNCEVNGKVDSDFLNGFGIFAGNSQNVRLVGNYVHDVKDGMAVFGGRNITVSGNNSDRVGSDGYKFSGITGLLVENNTGCRNIFPQPDAHKDFMQFQGDTTDVVIRGNLFLAGNQIWVQGIFFGNGTHKNVLIEQNIVYTGMANGIYVGAGSGITVRDNTLLNTPGEGHSGTYIKVPSGSVIQNNIWTSYKGGTSGTNVIAQHADSKGAYFYGGLFPGIKAGAWVTLQDLVPVPGSAAATKGAVLRLAELLSGSPGGTNRAPDAVDDAAVTAAGTPVTVKVLQNDADPDGDTLAVTGFTQPRNGTLVQNADGSFTYTPKAGFSGTDSFTYTISDRKGGEDSATVTLTVTAPVPVNTPPDAVNDAAMVREGESVTIAVLANDTDANGDALAVTAFTQPRNGTLVQTANGVFAYTPKLGFIGTDSFTYTVSDGKGGTDTATVTLTVTADDGGPLLPPALLAIDGPMTFAGSPADAVVLPHDTSLALAQGTVSLRFTASGLGGLVGLFSKDAFGYGRGGHLGIFLDGDDVWIRLQSTTASYEIRAVDAVETGQTQALAVTFGPDGLRLYLDGVLSGTNSYKGGLIGNAEPIVFGAHQWASSAGTADRIDGPFTGTIEHVRIYGVQLSASEIPSINYQIGTRYDRVVYGTEGDDTLLGSAGTDRMIGGPGNDTLTGGEGADLLRGTAGNDTLFGGAGDDLLCGGSGIDILTGGAGADRFRLLHAGAEHADQITDFASGEDQILLVGASFGLAPGALAAGQFRAGAQAWAPGERIIWTAGTGTLWFDPDGSGSAPALLLARLGAGTALAASDILVV